MNQQDHAMLAQVESVFGHHARPPHFTPEDGDFDCMEFDEMWRSRTKETLKLEDVFPRSRSPWSDLLNEGFLYYIPAIIRLVLLDKKTTGADWTGFRLIDSILNSRSFYEACKPAERAGIAIVIRYLIDSRSDDHDAAIFRQDMENIWQKWDKGF